MRERAERNPTARIALVGSTAADVRDVIIEGESGILGCSPPWNRPVYEPSKRRIRWKNGAQAFAYSAEEPDRLRGPQHTDALCDELAAWKYPEAYDQLQFGLRLGRDPRVVVTTTPRPTAIIRALIKESTTIVTRGSTNDNKANLAPAFLEQILKKYEGTRLGRQELNAEVLDDTPGALWTLNQIDGLRVARAPELVRIVVAIDPAATSTDGSDETGIVAAALGDDGHGYVLDDESGKYSPDGWARRAWSLFERREGNLIVAEVNNGGEMVESVIRTVAPGAPYKPVHAARGKRTRAEPVAALYEQGRVHHVGSLPKLEDQMCLVAGTLVTTTNGDLPIELIEPGALALTRAGWRRVTWAGKTGEVPVLELRTPNHVLRGSAQHPVWIEGRGFTPLADVECGDIVQTCHSRPGTHSSNSTGFATTATAETATSSQAERAGDASCIATSGSTSTDPSQQDGRSTTATRTAATIRTRISKPSPSPLTSECMAQAGQPLKTPRLEAPGVFANGPSSSQGRSFAQPVRSRSQRPDSGRATVLSVAETGCVESVFNLSVEDCPEFFANGILVHNCTWDATSGSKSPDRMDALVWALTELMVGGIAEDYESFRASRR